MNERREVHTPTRQATTTMFNTTKTGTPKPQFKPKGKRVDGSYVPVKNV